jgi:outer membrane receptor for monomeric catechols
MMISSLSLDYNIPNTSNPQNNTTLSLTAKIIDKTDFYQLVDRDMSDDEVKMEQFKGSVLCIVNVASK